jgi:polysaccharide pyruvyl transferase WcaK-like protein
MLSIGCSNVETAIHVSGLGEIRASMTRPVARIAVVDLWTDTNRGDCALQTGLIAMIRTRWPDAEVFGVFRFGTNEIDLAKPEIETTTSKLDGFCGGLRRTYYSAPNFRRFPKFIDKAVSLYSFFELTWVVLLALIGLSRLIPAERRVPLRAIRDADLVIWKGKNFRDYGGVGGLNRQMTLLSAGFVATLLNPNVHCVNASVWPMRNPVERWMVSAVFRRCRSISVRERGSLSAMAALRLPGVKVRFAQDLSFYSLRHEHRACGVVADREPSRYDAALTITRWGDKRAQQRYLETLATCIEGLIARGAKRFIIVPQVTRAAEDNSALAQSIVERFGSSSVTIEQIEGASSIDDILETYRASRLLIGTRMHSCVFAMAVGTPFVAIAYDAGPKWDILKEFWPTNFIFEYGSQAEDVASAAVTLYSGNREVLEKASRSFASLSDQSYSNVGEI